MSRVRVHNFAVSLDARCTASPAAARVSTTRSRAPGQWASARRMHIPVAPIVLGRGESVWDGLERLEERFHVESVTAPSGVTHVTFTRP